MYKVHYNSSNGSILGYYPDFIEYSAIPSPNIEIEDLDHQKVFSFSKIAKVIDGEFVLEDIPLPSEEETKQSQLDMLNRELENQLKEITLQFNADLASGMTLKESQSLSKTAILQVMGEYEEKIGLIESGVNPLEEARPDGEE